MSQGQREGAILKFPYGISDYYKIITNDYFYADRTDRIPLIENTGDHLLFLRPRRFGKSLLLSMLKNYYDIAKADEFEQLFGKLAIGNNPTDRHNQYFVLEWDFSGVEPSGETHTIRSSLHRYVNGTINCFASYYKHLLSLKIEIFPQDALASFQSLLTSVSQTPHKLYLLIDEYDNFANELMMSREVSRERYKTLVYGEGCLKALFKAVKLAAKGYGLDRAFITADCEFPYQKTDKALAVMRIFYNGYCFAYKKEALVYNPTLALYFMEYFQEYCEYPDEMLDENMAMERGKN